MNVFRQVTKQTLKKHKTRTLVTIIGIILSTAMITAVAVSVSSFQRYLLDYEIYENGNWHISFEDLPAKDAEAVLEEQEIKSGFFAQDVGYAKIESTNPYKPYLYVLGGDSEFFQNMPVHLTKGRLPETSEEIILPQHLSANGGVYYALGDTLTLELGDRYWEEQRLTQYTSFWEEDEEGAGERLVIRETRTYTVVGFYERPAFEGYTAPGYTALTAWDAKQPFAYLHGFFRLVHPKAVDDYMRQVDYIGETNSRVLLYEGVSDYGSFYRVMYSLAAILIGLIMFGSISLIYNAFSISVSDRIREFGLLSSIGATKRQLRKMVFMEAVYVSGIGIPIGILSGIVGMGITFFFLGNKMSYIVGIDKVQFHLSFSLPVLLVACLLSFLTVLLSAWLPSKRANKATAMDCIRQTEEVRVRAKEVKTPKLVYRLFGLEGMLGDKNFKRSRRRYRVTVASLFMSIVLFISASSFCTYLTDSVKDVFTYNDYDIMMQWQTATDGTKIDLTDTIASLKDTVGITGYSGMKRTYREGRLTDNTLLDKTVRLYGLTEETYQAYLKQVGLSLADYENEEAPLAIAMVENGTFNPETGRLEKQTVLDKSVRELLLINDTDDTEDTEEEEEQEILVKIGAYVDELPLGMNTEYVASGIYLFYPLKIYEGLFTENSENIIYFKTETPEATYQSFLRTAEEKGYSENWFYTIYEEMKRAKYLVMVIQTFSYGFITLITLISLANVFNTISTNVLLRRKEFAVLRSVGMTARGLRKILSYECILYGVKSLVLGIPVAFGVTYLIYRSIKEGYDTAFYLPIPAVGIAVGSVFLVVFAAMFYGMRKVKGDIIFSEID